MFSSRSFIILSLLFKIITVSTSASVTKTCYFLNKYKIWEYKKSSSLVTFEIFGKVIFSKELDNFNVDDFFKTLKNETYNGVIK